MDYVTIMYPKYLLIIGISIVLLIGIISMLLVKLKQEPIAVEANYLNPFEINTSSQQYVIGGMHPADYRNYKDSERYLEKYYEHMDERQKARDDTFLR